MNEEKALTETLITEPTARMAVFVWQQCTRSPSIMVPVWVCASISMQRTKVSPDWAECCENNNNNKNMRNMYNIISRFGRKVCRSFSHSVHTNEHQRARIPVPTPHNQGENWEKGAILRLDGWWWMGFGWRWVHGCNSNFGCNCQLNYKTRNNAQNTLKLQVESLFFFLFIFVFFFYYYLQFCSCLFCVLSTFRFSAIYWVLS